MAMRHAGDLHVTDAGQELADAAGQVALDNLAVIQIHLDLEVGRTHLGHDRMRISLRVQEIARNVAGVDRLDQQGDAGACAPSGGLAQVGDIGVAPAPAGGRID